MMSDRDLIDTGIVDWVWDTSHPDLVLFNYTDSDRATLARLLLRPCPKCEAVPGSWCRKASGERIVGLDSQHLARRNLAP